MTAVPGKDGADQLRILLQPGETFELPGGRGLDHLRRGRAVRRAVDPHRPGQVAHPRRGPALARRAGRLARHPPSKGVRAGWSGIRAGSYCGVRRRPGQGRRRRDARRARSRAERTSRNAMTDQTLAQLSNLAIYSAMAVLTLAMLADAVYLARLVPAREAAREAERERELVGWSAPVARHGRAPARQPGRHPSRRRRRPTVRETSRSRRARRPASAGRSPCSARCSSSPGVVLRALEVHRWPLGNMYEFAVFGAMFVLLAYCGVGDAARPALARPVRRDARAAQPRPGDHRLVHRRERADAVAALGVARHPRHGGHVVGGRVHDRVLARRHVPHPGPARERRAPPAHRS